MLEEGPEGNHQQADEVLQQQQGGAAAGASKTAQLQALQPAQAEAEGVAELQVRQQIMQLLLPRKRRVESHRSCFGQEVSWLLVCLTTGCHECCHLIPSPWQPALRLRPICDAMPGQASSPAPVCCVLHLTMWQLQDGQLATVWESGG